VLDVVAARKLRESFEDAGGGQALAVSPDGRFLASAGRGTLALFATSTGLLARPEWLLDADRVSFLDANTLAVGVLRDLKVVSLETGDGTWPLSGRERGAFAIAPGGRLAVSSDETAIVVRELGSNAVEARLEGGHATRIRSLAWSSRGALASASEDGRVVLWDPARAEPLARFSVENRELDRQRLRVAFSPDGSRIAVFGEENTVLFFDVNF